MQNKSLIQQLDREDLSKIYTRAAEYPSISTQLISDLLNNRFYGDLKYTHVRDVESILGKKIIDIFPIN
jgi:hypothetical protein